MQKQVTIQLNITISSLMRPVIDAGYLIYIVGGYVRDALLGHASYDVDFCTNAPLEQLIQIYADYKLNKQAMNYGAISFTHDNYSIQITRLRKDSNESDGRYPNHIEYVNRIEEDFIRRDFTINALYCDIDGNVIDPCNGLHDLHHQLIDTVIDANTSFQQDYLRILRALRFANRLNFNLSDNVNHAIVNDLDGIRSLSAYRLHQELKGFGLYPGYNRYINLYQKVLSTYFGQEVPLTSTPLDASNEVFFYAYQWKDKSNDYIKFILTRFGYSAQFANSVNDLKPFILEDKNIDIIFKKRLAAKYYSQDILVDLSNYYGIDLVDEVDHLQRMDIVLTQKQIKCSTSDMKKINIAPHEFKKTYQFLLEALYTNQVKNNKDALLQYIKDHRIEYKKYMNA